MTERKRVRQPLHRLTLTVPEHLYKQMLEELGDENWSRIFVEAIQAKLAKQDVSHASTRD